jgi:DNA-binding Lrp family transcriptional regulator
VEAFILVNTEPGWLWKVAEEAAKIEGVKISRAVSGQFDVIIYVESLKIEDLGGVIEKLQSIKGVARSQTSIAMPVSAYSLSPWPTRAEEEEV